MRLQNFCIDKNDNGVISIQEKSVQNVKRTVRFSKLTRRNDAKLVNTVVNGRPIFLLSRGHQFAEAKSYRHNRALESMPIDKMIKSLDLQQLQRPQY